MSQGPQPLPTTLGVRQGQLGTCKGRVMTVFRRVAASRSKWSRIVALVIVAVLAFGVVVVHTREATAPCPVFSSIDPPWAGRCLTRYGYDTYSLAGSATVSAAASNSGGNTRTLWWDCTQSASTDEQSCASLGTPKTNAIHQQGVALRITDNRAITVIQNIWWGGTWGFLVSIWDTANPDVVTGLAGFDLGSVFRPMATTLSCCRGIFAPVSPGIRLHLSCGVHGQPQPMWGDTSHGGTVRLPDGWVYAGSAGFSHRTPATRRQCRVLKPRRRTDFGHSDADRRSTHRDGKSRRRTAAEAPTNLPVDATNTRSARR